LAASTALHGEAHLETGTAHWHLARDLEALGDAAAPAELARAEAVLALVPGGGGRLADLRRTAG
jgi:hypothetical protein